jgi:uncharacterized protein
VLVVADVPLRIPAHQVDPAARWLWAVEGLATTLVVTGGWLVAWIVGRGHAGHGWVTLAGAVALPVLALLSIVVQPRWRYRVHRWEVTDEAVYTLVGLLDREWRIVPVARIQTVDTRSGPVQQLLGLTSVSIKTASHAGSTHVEHLATGTAMAVAHDLAQRANAVRDEVT